MPSVKIPQDYLMTKEEISEEIRKIIRTSGLTIPELAQLLEVKMCTISSWNEGKRVPQQFVLNYAKEKIRNHFKKPKTNADVIREMSDEELVVFLDTIKEDALEAKGNPKNVCDEFRDFNAFLKSKELIKG